MSRKTIICLVFLASILFNSVFVFSTVIVDANTKNYLDFYIIETPFEPGNYVINPLENTKYRKYNWGRTPFYRPADDRMLTLWSEFSIDTRLRDHSLYLPLFIFDYPYSVYLNGHLLTTFGDYKESYTSRELYHNDSINELVIQLYPKQGEISSVSQPFIASAEIVKPYIFWKNFWGHSMVRTIAFVSLMISFYFFLIFFLSKPSFINQNLYLALFNFFVAITYINNVFSFDFANTFILEKTVRAGFVLYGASLLGFFLIYTSFPRKKMLLWINTIIAAIILFVALIQPDLISVNKVWSNITSPYLLFMNFFVLFITFRYWLKVKTLASFLFFITFLAHIFAAMYDLYYFVFLQIRPYVLFTPFLVFVFTMVVFLVLANEQAQTYFLTFKQAKKLKKLSEGLEIEVNNRTIELKDSVEELKNEIDHHKQTQTKLQEMNATKDKFFSIIAHDLKSPFNALLGYSNLLTGSIENSDLELTSRYAKMIQISSVNAYNLLENLLIWAGAQTGSIRFNPEIIDIQACVNENIDLVSDQVLAKNINISNEVIKTDVLADKYMIDTVLRNLLSNAIKFTHKGGEIKISSVEEENKLEIIVADSGIGIKNEDLEKLFRIDNKHTTDGTVQEKGTGLGLLLCKEFIEKHQGEIRIESEPEKGSRFCFTLPKNQ